ncbi:MAG TPA: efflux RND transporter periplasmic adaptor subunit, partial [Polyangia bacterium]|nr:efflux RND transporter periplasmic adaptor subunit [Polyangia bacterium]
MSVQTKTFTKLMAVALLGLGALPACEKGHAESSETTPSGGGEAARDFIQYQPGNAPQSFLKIESVTETGIGTSASMPARIAFDEDHTQRVASPIDGRATQILVKVGDKVRAGQPLVLLSSPNVGQLQADAQKADSDLSVAQKGVDRVHKLQADGAIAEKDVALAEADLRKARSDQARTAAQLRALGISA